MSFQNILYKSCSFEAQTHLFEQSPPPPPPKGAFSLHPICQKVLSVFYKQVPKLVWTFSAVQDLRGGIFAPLYTYIPTKSVKRKVITGSGGHDQCTFCDNPVCRKNSNLRFYIQARDRRWPAFQLTLCSIWQLSIRRFNPEWLKENLNSHDSKNVTQNFDDFVTYSGRKPQLRVYQVFNQLCMLIVTSVNFNITRFN